MLKEDWSENFFCVAADHSERWPACPLEDLVHLPVQCRGDGDEQDAVRPQPSPLLLPKQQRHQFLHLLLPRRLKNHPYLPVVQLQQ